MVNFNKGCLKELLLKTKLLKHQNVQLTLLERIKVQCGLFFIGDFAQTK